MSPDQIAELGKRFLMAGFGDIPTEQITQIAAVPLVGALCILLGFVLWQREKEWSKRQTAWDTERAKNAADRLADFTKLMDQMRDTNIVTVQTNIAAEGHNAAVKSVAEALRLHTATIEQLITTYVGEFARLTVVVERAAESNRQLREALVSEGGLRPRP